MDMARSVAHDGKAQYSIMVPLEVVFSRGNCDESTVRDIDRRAWCFPAWGIALLVAATRPVRPAMDGRVLVHTDSLGVSGVMLDNGLKGRILVYGNGRARVSFGADAPRVLLDTVRLRSVPSFTADVTDSDLHLELVGGQLPGGGVVHILASVVGTPETHFRGTGRHVVILKGGAGVQVRDRGNPRFSR